MTVKRTCILISADSTDGSAPSSKTGGLDSGITARHCGLPARSPGSLWKIEHTLHNKYLKTGRAFTKHQPFTFVPFCVSVLNYVYSIFVHQIFRSWNQKSLMYCENVLLFSELPPQFRKAKTVHFATFWLQTNEYIWVRDHIQLHINNMYSV